MFYSGPLSNSLKVLRASRMATETLAETKTPAQWNDGPFNLDALESSLDPGISKHPHGLGEASREN